MSERLVVKKLCKNGILKDINFTINDGEMVAVMGPSGSGKSTLLYQVSGMDRSDSGEVWLDSTEICTLSEDNRAKIRLSQMGFVFQQMNMLKNLTLLDNIMLPASRLKKGKSSRQEIEQRARMLMGKMGIEELAERKITEVSGGQLQRACICRSMMNQPKILFADEPTGALNQSAAQGVMVEFTRLNKGKSSKQEIEQRARMLMGKMGIEELAERKITEVSGGQLQRACICRSMMNQPKILFADEPTGALNQSAAQGVMEEFTRLNKENTTIFMVTHDSKIAARCSRILYLLDGSIKGELSLEKILEEKDREERVKQWLAEMGW